MGGGCDDLGLSQQLSGFPFASSNGDVAAPSDDWVAVANGGWELEVAADIRHLEQQQRDAIANHVGEVFSSMEPSSGSNREMQRRRSSAKWRATKCLNSTDSLEQ